MQEFTQPAVTSSKFTIETLEQGVKVCVFIANFEHILHLVFLLLTLSRKVPTGIVLLYAECKKWVYLF